MKNVVLTIDDSKVILKINKKMLLELFPDCEVLSFLSPKEAIEGLEKLDCSINFALLDYNMEGMDGVELAQKLVDNETCSISYQKIAIVSANIQPAVQEKAKGLGMDFIPKPLDQEKLEKFLKDRELL